MTSGEATDSHRLKLSQRRPTPPSRRIHAGYNREEPGHGSQKAVETLLHADAWLICAYADNTDDTATDSGIWGSPPQAANAENIKPRGFSSQPLNLLRRDQPPVDGANLFMNDPEMAWAYWGFWCTACQQAAPHSSYNYLADWARSRRDGFFCVTSEISSYWAHAVGESRVWETQGSILHLQRVDGTGVVWRLGTTPTSLLVDSLAAGVNSSAKAAAKAISDAGSLLGPAVETRNNDTDNEQENLTPSALGSTSQLPDTPPQITLPFTMPPHWDLCPGEQVEVRRQEPVDNTSVYQWTQWESAVVGRDGFSMFSNTGQLLRAESVRRPGPEGVDFLRAQGSLPTDPRDVSALARPNVRMSGDAKFVDTRSSNQERRLYSWRNGLPKDCQLAVLQIGVKRRDPVDMLQAERAASEFPGAVLVRIGASGKEPKMWEGRCVNASFDASGALDTNAALERLRAELGPAPPPPAPPPADKVRPSQKLPLGSSQPSGSAQDSQVDKTEGAGVEKLPDEVSSTSAVDWDRLGDPVDWDNIRATDPGQDSSVLGQLRSFATGFYTAASESSAATDEEVAQEEEED